MRLIIEIGLRRSNSPLLLLHLPLISMAVREGILVDCLETVFAMITVNGYETVRDVGLLRKISLRTSSARPVLSIVLSNPSNPPTDPNLAWRLSLRDIQPNVQQGIKVITG